ncbi:MAG: shikimate kinase [Nannocystaceae bacterium]
MAALLPGCPVFLTGMMGSGKSTIAPLLAAHWQVAWIDLDARVQRLFGSTIPAMFARGERYFRECESQALRSLMAEPGVRARTVVVATGGGVVVDPKNRQQMHAAGAVVYLDVPGDCLAARLMRPDDLGNRPLLGGTLSDVKTRVQQLLEDREPAYRRATYSIDANAEPGVCVARIVAAISGDVPRGRT